MKRTAYTAWLLVGLAVFRQGLVTGGGFYGAIAGWQIERWGAMLDPLLGIVLLGLLLTVPPAILLVRTLPGMGSSEVARRAWVRCGLAVGTWCFALLMVAMGLIHQSPDGLAAPLKIDLDRIGKARIPDHTAELMGTLQTEHAVSYEELHRNAHRRRVYAPLTPSGWSPSQPVRFVVEPEGEGGPRRYSTHLGMLLSGRVPGYVRALFERRGVTLADDVMLQAELGTETDTLFVLASIGFLGGLLGFLLAFVAAYLQPPVQSAWVEEAVIRRRSGLDQRTIVYLLWLVAGVAIALHDFTTGGGLYGVLAGWSIRHGGSLSTGMCGVPWAFALILPPAALLFAKSFAGRTEVERAQSLVRGGLVAAGILFAIAAGAFLYSYAAPDPTAAPVQVVLDEAGPAPPDHTAIVVGALHTRQVVGYTVYTKLGHHRRVFVPLTASTWKPGDAVRFLVEPREIAIGVDRPYTSGRGMLLHGQVPGYVRGLFQDEGIVLADDVMLHTWRWGDASGTADIAAMSAAFGGVIGLTLALGGWSRRRMAQAYSVAEQ